MPLHDEYTYEWRSESDRSETCPYNFVGDSDDLVFQCSSLGEYGSPFMDRSETLSLRSSERTRTGGNMGLLFRQKTALQYAARLAEKIIEI